MVQKRRREMMKKKFPLLILVALGFGLTTAQADDVLPKAKNFARYEPMLKHSPFAVATAAAPVAAAPDFAKDLYVANAAHTEKGDFVTLASTTNREFKEYLTTGETIDGYSIPNILWSDRVGETKVTVTKDGQVATLGFNEAVLSEDLPQMASAPQPTQNFVHRPGMAVPFPHPMKIPTIPTPPPHTRALIRRNIPTPQAPSSKPNY
ncbi:MAG TPA: hypothetical protein VGI85_05185 [Chthoniobacterales bacterium]